MTTWLSYKNWVDQEAATITAAEEAGDLVATNLANRYSSSLWRDDTLTAMDATTWFKVDFGVAREVGCLALLFPRSNAPNSYDADPMFETTDTVRFKLSNVAEDGYELLDTTALASGVHAGYGYYVYKLTSPVTARWLRCDLNAVSRGSLGYVDVCRAWAGPVIEPAIGPDFGAVHAWSSDSVVTQAARGISDFVDPREPIRSYAMTLGWLTEAERDQMEDLERLMSTSGQFLVVRGDMNVARGAMFARQQRSTGLEAIGAHLRHRKTFQLVESL